MPQKEVPGRRRPTPAHARTPRTTLTRDQVVDAAIRVLETGGYPALSMRRVAQELDVGTMSLYWHVADRDELLDLVVERVVSEQVLDEVPGDWRAALRAIAHGALAMFVRYPWIVDAGPRPRIGALVLEHVEQSIAATESTGLSMTGRLAATSAIDHFVLGYVLQNHVRPNGEPDLTDAARAAVAAGRFPRYAAFVADGSSAAEREWHGAQDFDLGLEMLLDGIAVAVERGRLPAVGAAPARPRRRRKT